MGSSRTGPTSSLSKLVLLGESLTRVRIVRASSDAVLLLSPGSGQHRSGARRSYWHPTSSLRPQAPRPR